MRYLSLVVADIHGTLTSYNPNGPAEISKTTANSIRRAQNHKILVVPASGQYWRDMENYFIPRDLHFPVMIYMHGAGIRFSDQNHYRLVPNQKKMEDVLRLAENENVRVTVCSAQGEWFVSHNAPELFAREVDQFKHSGKYKGRLQTYLNFTRRFLPGKPPLSNINPQDPIFNIKIYIPEEEREEQIRQQILEMGLGVEQAGYGLEVVHGDASKGNALEIIAKRFHIPQKFTVAFGNDPNDFSMLTAAQYGFLMPGTDARVKQALSEQHGGSRVNLLGNRYVQNGVAKKLDAWRQRLNHMVRVKSLEERPSVIRSRTERDSIPNEHQY